MASAIVLGAARRRVLELHSVRFAQSESVRAGLSRELFRGRCLRALGWRAFADGSGMGGSIGQSSADRQFRRGETLPPQSLDHGAVGRTGTNIRGRLGMDAKPVRTLSALRARQRRHWGVQRQVHVQSVCAAGWLMRDFTNSYPPDVSKL